MQPHFTPEPIIQALADDLATLAAGQAFSQRLTGGVTVYLEGDLGAGKTTFVRGVLQGLGYTGKVKSPTYTLVESYDFAEFNFYHFDLYRFNDEEEWELAGFREYFNAQSICFVEWPSKAAHLLPTPSTIIKIKLLKKQNIINGRLIEIVDTKETGHS